MRDEGGKKRRTALRRRPSICRPNPIHEMAVLKVLPNRLNTRIASELGDSRLPENQG